MKLKNMDYELKESLTRYKERTIQLTHQLTRAAARRQHLHLHNRQTYQELEQRQNVLLAAQRAGLEYREQNQRVKTSVEVLRKEFPRLIAKIKKTPYEKITIDELPSAIHRVEDEIANLIKDIDRYNNPHPIHPHPYQSNRLLTWHLFNPSFPPYVHYEPVLSHWF